MTGTLRMAAGAFALTVALVPSVGLAALIDRGGGLIYDTDLNITWLQDARYAAADLFIARGRMPSHLVTWWIGVRT
jgi:hypothetical protein